MIFANAAIPGSYDYGEVANSVLIAVAASYVALDLAGRVTAAKAQARLAWLGGGATAMGIGIWAMHVTGMLAFHLPVRVAYHWPTLLASLLVAIFASWVALYVASRPNMGWRQALTGSAFMAGGIVGLHYVSMAAMRLPAITRYSPPLVTFSILLAILFSLLALLLAFDLREETRWTVPRRLGSAIVMGAAVSAMHYTGMAAASFIPASPPNLSHTVSISAIGNNAFAIVTSIVLVAAMVTASVDRRVSAEVERIAQELEQDLTRVTRAAAMGELAAAIAHEVNQPLTAIVTNGNFCLRQLEGTTVNPAEFRAAITEIVNDATRASAIISRIRGLLKKDAARRTKLDINHIIQEVTILLPNELNRNRVSLRTELAPDLPRVQGDTVQLQQVLINLIMNAIEATRTATEGKREIVIRTATNPDGVLVQVQDSGLGIGPELADRIFEPFFTTKAEGIGMGLSISHSIIESHGGRLWNTPSSAGALFEFALPADDADIS